MRVAHHVYWSAYRGGTIKVTPHVCYSHHNDVELAWQSKTYAALAVNENNTLTVEVNVNRQLIWCWKKYIYVCKKRKTTISFVIYWRIDASYTLFIYVKALYPRERDLTKTISAAHIVIRRYVEILKQYEDYLRQQPDSLKLRSISIVGAFILGNNCCLYIYMEFESIFVSV